MSMTFQLVRVPSALVKGIYNDPDGSGPKLGILPSRALLVHPEAYADFMAVAPRTVWSDLCRSGESSLSAYQVKAGVQPPSFSHHNWGKAGDCAITESIRYGGFKNRAELDDFLTAHHFPPFWIHSGADAPPPYDKGFETWHHSHLMAASGRNTADEAEAWIQERFGKFFNLSLEEVQIALAAMKLYHGEIDAGRNPKNFGPKSREALAMFQRGWCIARTCKAKGAVFVEGQTDWVTMRTLAFATAKIEIVEAPVAAPKAA